MVKKYEIWWVNLDPTIGHEIKKTRPALVISNNAMNDNLPVVQIVPISSYKDGVKIYRSELFLPKCITNLQKDSILMLHQIRTVDIKRLTSKAGQISKIDYIEKIKNIIRLCFIED